MTAVDAQALADTVREGIKSLGDPDCSDCKRLLAALDALVEALGQRDEALRKIARRQPVTLAMIESNGFVFDDIGREPNNWKHLAFTIYTDLCEVDSLARAALDLDIGSPVPVRGDEPVDA